MSTSTVTIGSTTIKGFTSPASVANYNGIPFAHVAERFREATPVDPAVFGKGIDATAFGPRCPQPLDQLAAARSYLFDGLAPQSEKPDDDLDCLRLNVYTPAEQVEGQEKLPVFVWIHGGGYAVGDGNKTFDGKFLIEHAVNLGKPFVFVALNYRLGLYGFLTSRELQEEAAANGGIGYANRGYHDQRLGLEWIQRHISYFGGDPAKVTIAGESAGGLSVLAQLRSNKPLFHQALISSAPIWPMITQQESQDRFDKIIEAIGVASTASSAERLAAIRKLSNERCYELLGGAPAITPTFDEKWFVDQPHTPMEEMCRLPSHVKRVIVGFARDDFALLAVPWQQWSTEQLQIMVRAALPDETFADEVLAAYGIGKDQQAALKGVIDFGTESFFVNVSAQLAKSEGVPVHLYRFDQADLHEGSPFHGYAYHALDTAFFMRYPSVAGPEAKEEERATADRVSKMVTAFVYGEDLDWPAAEGGAKAHLLEGPKSKVAELNELGRLAKLTSTEERKKMVYAAPPLMLMYQPKAA